jgi:polysaccharide pyruvyl transferase WcaK-like protein
LFSSDYHRDSLFGLNVDYPALMRSIIRYFHDQANVEVHLIGHVQSEKQPLEDDQRAGEALAAEFPGVVVAPSFANPSDAKSYIAAMDYFLGARLHACIAAFSSGVPFLPMAYSRKVEGVFGSLGYNVLADCRVETAEEILTKVKATFENRRQLKVQVDAAHERGLTRLKAYETLLAECLSSLRRERA